MKDQDKALEQRCLGIGDFLAEALPGPEAPPNALPPELAAAFQGARLRGRPWRRPLSLSLAGLAAAAAFVLWLSVRARPLEFAVDGTVAEADGFFEAAGPRAVEARFSDGTVVSVRPGGPRRSRAAARPGPRSR